MDFEMDAEGKPDPQDLAYIRYSAKELLFHQGQQLAKLQEGQTAIQLSMTSMVTRQELTNTRRWVVGAVIASVVALVGVVEATLRL